MPAFFLTLSKVVLCTVLAILATSFAASTTLGESSSKPIWKNFLTLFLVLFITSVIDTAIGYYYSIDVRGWWPIILFIWLMCDVGIAFIYALISEISKAVGIKYTLIYGFGYSIMMIFGDFNYYLHWYDARYDSYISTAGAFLLVHAVFCLRQKLKQSQAAKSH